MRKPVFGVSDQIRNKLGCTTTEDGKGFEILRFKKERDCTIYVAKTKALISCAATVQLIFVFTYAKSRFSHDMAHICDEKDTNFIICHYSAQTSNFPYMVLFFQSIIFVNFWLAASKPYIRTI